MEKLWKATPLLLVCSLSARWAIADVPQPPATPKIPHQLIEHGDVRVDNYFWLRDDSRSNAKVLRHLEDENNYSREVLKPSAVLTDRLYREMVARMSPENRSVPFQRNGYRYQDVYLAGQEYAVSQRQPVGGEGDWQTLVDGNLRAKGQAYYQRSGLVVSQDNQMMAIAEDTTGRRQYRLSLRDLNSGQWLPDEIENTSGNMVWSNDGRYLFYLRNNPQTLVPSQVWRHRPGTPVAEDVLVYQETDGGYYLGLSRSASDRYLIITLSASTSSEARLIDADKPETPPVLFATRRPGIEYYLDHFEGEFYLRANQESANFGLYKSHAPGDKWLAVVAPDANKMVEGFTLFKDWLVVAERRDGLSQIRKINWLSHSEQTLQFDDASYMAWLGYNPEPQAGKLRYGYSSMTTPTSTYEWDLASGERTLLKRQEVNNTSPQNYHSERIWVTARDGVKVPVSLVYNKKMFKPAHSPLLVYGYGAYGMSMDPAFSANRLSLLDRGFVFAIVHVRGGGELGQQWYQQGKLENKPNSFNDFLDATHGLVKLGFGQAGRLYAMGGSAGGLLMGNVINQQPTLFNAVVAQVPFVDVVTTMLDESLPLTVGEYDEWGNPHRETDYLRLKSWSPYDNVKPSHYPNLLVTSGLNDSQVQYWEPAKWVAKLRDNQRGPGKILLLTDMQAGHGGKSGRIKRLENTALEYSFILEADKQR
ncbi:S9 family peptidase [Cedecea neteri]|uniref:S9 family peptidase n=1 Tax=Cedecea neteri TaxID=158822 RepID=UPI0028935AD0|nr:S9 family peptidase [Cedecea neteri]WNJ77480.1 S9 family peptidase [Cedecea neteri]